MRRIINTFYIFHSVFFDISFDPLLGHDFLHVCKVMFCKLEVPKMWENSLVFFSPVLQFSAICIFNSHI
jgi:hypothetical protein